MVTDIYLYQMVMVSYGRWIETSRFALGVNSWGTRNDNYSEGSMHDIGRD